jgi:hypothetical protein
MMSQGQGPGLGGGGFFGAGGPFGGGMGPRGGPMGGPFGGMGGMGPRGQFGPWPACGCSGLLMVLAGIILVCAGFFRLMNQ